MAGVPIPRCWGSPTHVDEVAIRVAEATGATLITAHAPRAMLDLNRARDDVDWDMVSGLKPRPVRHSQSNRRARNGLGLVPRRLPGFGEIWRGKLTGSELDRRIEGIHRPYHSATARELARLAGSLQDMVARFRLA